MHSPIRLALASLTLAACGLLAPALDAQVISGDVESGNIDQVIQVGPDAYDITLRTDTGATDKQWFHFSVSQAAGRTLSFELQNVGISAPWVAGMAPCVGTDLTDPSSWSRVPADQVSFANQDVAFSYSFPDDGTYHFAYSFVYPVSRAQQLVAYIAQSPYAEQRVLAQSLQGRPIDLLEITEGDAPGKRGLWIQARQHPAECGSSWTCEALLQWLVGPSAEARALRRAAVVRVVPMMNPDGVALGNYRRNSIGLDLNREWDDATPASAPSVAAVLDELAAFDAEVGLDLFLDLHTHSSELKNWVFGVDGDPAFDLLERGWPQELEAHEPDFSHALSSFVGVDPTVAKNQVHASHPDALSYTLEQTIHTIPYGPHADEPISIARYADMGLAIGTSLVSFLELTVEPWVDLGAALPGTHGEPLCTPFGALVGDDPLSLELSAAREDATAWLVVGLSVLSAPFRGGVLVPDPTPPGFFVSVPTDGQGAATIGAVWPLAVPSDVSVVAQWWIDDPAAVQGLSASNGVIGTTP